MVGVRVHSALDPERLARALTAVEDRQDVLRSTYRQAVGDPWRVVQPTGSGQSPRLDVREVRGLDDDRLLELARLAGAAPFDLAAGDRPFRAVLLRRADDDAILVVAAHHIAADAPSLFLILRDLLQAYQMADGGGQPVLSPLPHTYDDYVRREQALLGTPRAARMARHWAEVSAGSAAARLPADRPAPARSTYAGKTRQMRATAGFTERLRAASRSTRVTPFAYLLAAFQATLHRHTGQDDFLVGTAVALRLRPGMRDVVGYMVNSLPLRARVRPATTLADMVSASSDGIRQGLAHAGYPYPLMNAAPAPLFRITCTMLAVERMPVALPAEHAGLRLSFVDIPQQEGQFDLSVELRYSTDSLTGAFRYDTDILDGATIDGLADRFTRFADLTMSEPGSRVADLPLVDDAELGRLLAFGGIG
jgi:hypothetical protein